MTKLDNWKYTETFTGAEAACLIIGIDPNDPGADHFKAIPILERLREGYKHACGYHYSVCVDGFFAESIGLESVAMQRARDAEQANDHDFMAWMDSDAGGFDQQEFTGKILSEYLAAAGIKSVFSFEQSGKPGADDPDKPIPTKERESLVRLFAIAANAGWGFDPGSTTQSSLVSDIVEAARDLGISIDPGTARKYVKEARETVRFRTAP